MSFRTKIYEYTSPKEIEKEEYIYIYLGIYIKIYYFLVIISSIEKKLCYIYLSFNSQYIQNIFFSFTISLIIFYYIIMSSLGEYFKYQFLSI